MHHFRYIFIWIWVFATLTGMVSEACISWKNVFCHLILLWHCKRIAYIQRGSTKKSINWLKAGSSRNGYLMNLTERQRRQTSKFHPKRSHWTSIIFRWCSDKVFGLQYYTAMKWNHDLFKLLSQLITNIAIFLLRLLFCFGLSSM